MPHSLRTERLLIRPIMLRDARAYWLTHNDPEFTRMTGTWSYPFTEQDVMDRIRDVLASKAAGKQWFAFIGNEQLVGTGVLFDWQPGSVEIGYDIGAGFTGRGLATEAAHALCRFVFSAYALKTVRARVSLDNPASSHILRRLGFEQTGEAEMGWSAHYGMMTPLYHYRLIRERFRP
ncbi:MAG: GNAT family N-acetyltransferase [Pseudomonadota bacterium]